METSLIYFSPTNSTKEINDYYGKHIKYDLLYNITNPWERENIKDYLELAIISFPIYGQTIPLPVLKVLKRIHGKYAILNITYGSINYGNGAFIASRILKQNGVKIIGLAIIPTKHAYHHNPRFNDFNLLKPIISKINRQDWEEIKIKKTYQNPLAKIFPKLRTHLGVKMILNKEKCTKCGQCIRLCPAAAINNDYTINHNCLRCLRCTNLCDARSSKKHLLLKLYLKIFLKDKQNKVYY